jgi:hypothetical protein
MAMEMKPIALTLLIGSLLTDGAHAPVSAESSAVFSGEVWTWDGEAGTVTLRQFNGQTVRVKVPRELLQTLRLHQTVTLRGELAPPVAIEHVQLPPGPMAVVPEGMPTRSELRGTITSVDRAGTVSIASPSGPLRVWIGTAVEGRSAPRSVVRVRTTVQRVRMVPASTSAAAPPAPAPSAGSEPGDYAVVVGRITSVDPDARITVESPRGPVTVWAPANFRLDVGQTVEVRTSVHPAR